MNTLIRAEVLKLRTARSYPAVAIGAILLIVAAVAATAAAGSFKAGDHPGRDSLSLAGIAHTFALLLGVLAVTSEFRHGTITPALLTTPKRMRLLTAKLTTLAAGALVLGLLAFGLAAAVGLPALHQRGIDSQLGSNDVAAIIAGGTMATVLFAALGVGLGALVRNQVGTVVAALVLLYAIDPLLSLLPALGHTVQTFGLDGLSTASDATTSLSSNAHQLHELPALLVLASYAAGVVVLGSLAFQRRDITS